MRIGPLDIEAISVGGLETCIELPAWNLAFDIGRCPPGAVRRQRLFLTHCHMDHAGGLAYHAATRDLMAMQPPTYYVPRENFEDLRELFDVWRRLDRSALPCELVPVAPGDSVPIGRNLIVAPFRSPHRVHCQGYAIRAKRSKLKAEYVGMEGAELGRRKLAGERITDEVEAIEFAFTGDTLIEVVEREEMVRTARVLVMECTFLDDRVPVAKSRESGHVHLDELVERVDLFANERILLTHFSARYSRREITEILERRLPESLKARVTALLPPLPER